MRNTTTFFWIARMWLIFARVAQFLKEGVGSGTAWAFTIRRRTSVRCHIEGLAYQLLSTRAFLHRSDGFLLLHQLMDHHVHVGLQFLNSSCIFFKDCFQIRCISFVTALSTEVFFPQ